MSLKIDWATHEAAKFACENWHYSKCMPVNKLVKVGAWENGIFIGVIIFSPGASSSLGKRYGLGKQEVCELTRIALKQHENPVSKILSIAIKFLKKSNPKLKMIISFADPRQNHHGGIYQATNWLYEGTCEPGGAYEYLINGKWTHQRSAKMKFGYVGKKLIKNKKLEVRKPSLKHRYLYLLDKELKLKLNIKPYPKRVSSVESGTTSFQEVRGGESPTDTLQLKAVRNG